MTNREMLSAMNNRELAIWLNDLSYKKICCICKYRGICRDIKDGCFNGITKWLESEGICNGILFNRYRNCMDILDDIDKYKYDSDVAKPRLDNKCTGTYKDANITCDK